MKKVLLLMMVMLFLLSSCSSAVTIKSSNLMDGIIMEKIDLDSNYDLKTNVNKLYNFYFDLFSTCKENKNAMLSPLSLVYCLGMTSNGADGNTLKELEDTLGVKVDNLNYLLYAYTHNYGNEVCKIANSIWFKDEADFSPNKDFLQLNANYYNAGVYKSNFDEQTVKDINNWTSQKTDGMIEEILKDISKDAVMYLINAIAFSGKWEDKVTSSNVENGEFIDINNNIDNVEYLKTKEDIYYEDINCVGFEKAYQNEYTFKAFIPKTNVTFNDFFNSFDSEKYNNLLKNKSREYIVHTKIPKFKFEYELELIDILKGLGINDIFDKDLANLSKLGSCKLGENLYVSKVLQKTFIDLDEEGTKAAAATIIGINKATSMLDEQEIKEVFLNKPFIFMICDSMDNPIFIGKYLDK